MNPLERARLAGEVINNEVYASAYELLQQRIIEEWRDAKDTESRERLHLSLKLLSKVRQVLESAMTSGEIERKKLDVRERSRLGQMFNRDW